MGKFKNAFYRFMYGRYGGDTLNKVLLGVYVALVILFSVSSLVISFFPGIPASVDAILYAVYLTLSILLIVVIFFRIFSRNIAKRRKENEKFCGFFRLLRNRFRDRKTHVYRKCPQCKVILRLPKAKGKHYVVCPRCKHRFQTKG